MSNHENRVGYHFFMPQPPNTPAGPYQTPQAETDPTQGVFPGSMELADALVGIGLLFAAVVAAFLIHFLVFRAAARLIRARKPEQDVALLKALRGPSLLFFNLAAIQIVFPGLLEVFGTLAGIVRHAMAIGLIIAIAWMLIRLLDLGTRIALNRFDTSVADNLQARQMHTQIVVIRRIMLVVIGLVGIGAALMTFPSARQIGTSFLASAGIAGIAVGIAARPVMENLIAGLQIAFTQPIRLDDVVVIDGEWGRIEEITATFVVVRIWDQRRLIVPLSHVISNTFQNWTRQTADIIGTVFVHTDYTVPVERVREFVLGYLKDHPKWDGRVGVLQITEAGERTLQLRALVSAASSGDAWDLRCDTREAMIGFIKREFPDALPRIRTGTDTDAGAASEVARAGG